MTRLIFVLCICLGLSAAVAFGCGEPGSPMNCADIQVKELTSRFGVKDSDARNARAFAFSIGDDIERNDLRGVARHTDRALDLLVERAVSELIKRGHSEYAYFKQAEWRREVKGIATRYLDSKDIGDHPDQVLSVWLRDFYAKVEFILGIEICKALHISDIKSINETVKIVFRPCSFNMDSVDGGRSEEYKRHFAQGDVYYGLVPVVTYWAVTASTFGSGAFFIAPVAEFAMGRWIAPKLSDFIYERACE